MLLALLVPPALPLYFETFATPHYLAPFLACLMLLLFQSLASLFRQSKWLGVGRYAIVAVCLLFGLGYLGYWKRTVIHKLADENVCPAPAPGDRAATGPASGPSNSVFVQYSADYSIHDEWVYNRADLQQAKVVFAHDLSNERDESLLAEYPGRQALRLTLSPSEAMLAPLNAAVHPK